MKKQFIFTILGLLTLSLLYGCGSSNNAGSSSPVRSSSPTPVRSSSPTPVQASPTPDIALQVSIGGKLGSGYKIASKGFSTKSTEINVTAICAVPYSPEHLWEMNTYLGQAQLATIQSDESFSLSLNKTISTNWVLLLLDTNEAEKIDQVKGYVAVKVDDSNNLIQFSLDAANSSINLGTLETSSNSTDEAQTTQTTEAASFNLSPTVLLEMAKTDETLKGLKNLYANFNPTTGKYFFIDPVYLWDGWSQSTINNRYPEPTELFAAGNHVYYFYLKTNSLDYDPQNVLDHNSTLTMTPPAPIDIANIDFSGIGESGVAVITDEAAYATYESSGVIMSEWLYFKGQVPSGKWVEKVGSKPICTFDLSATYSTDEAGRPKLYIPVVQVTTNESSIVTSIDIKWYVNTGSGFEPVTDLTTLAASLGGNMMLWLSSGPGAIDEYHYFNGLTTKVDTFSHNWTFPRTVLGTPELSSITIDYNRNFVGYRFAWDSD